MRSAEIKLRRDALAIFRAALHAAEAGNAVRRHLSISRGRLKVNRVSLPLKAFDRVFLVAVGKAAVEMGAAVHSILGMRLSGGIAVTKHAPRKPTLPAIQVIEAEHPIPGRAGFQAASKILELLAELNARDLLIVAVSGGASALLPAPAEPVTLEAKQGATDLLLRAGADIGELNAIRKHLSLLKGGRLAARAYPATVVGLILSDVIGDRLDTIGSGLTAPDDSTFQDALRVIGKFALQRQLPTVVRRRLESGARGEIAETPKSGDPIFENVHNIVVGSNRLALEAAARQARSLGYRPLILSTSMQGEAREAARVHAEILNEVVRSGNPARGPVCILSGGETTVTVRGDGTGGRNQEFALAAALGIDGLRNALVLSAGTDGTDGPTDAAGAIATGSTIERALRLGLDARDYLRENDSHPFFNALGDLIRTGPTGTNVMDVHMLLAARS
ncbi:MAG: glycerate kinase [Acidobacteriaceae bacterium]|nr:glycerate kinase [Acidobacteriaceae bacterium]